MSNKPIIIWEKWIDPFGDDNDDAKWMDYDNDIDDVQNTYDDGSNQNIFRKSKPIRVIASPLGFIPYNEYTASSRIFNFWMGHTNFNISQMIQDTIESVNGVEILDIFTRYRFRIGIGKCFNDSDVMSDITSSIIQGLNKYGIE